MTTLTKPPLTASEIDPAWPVAVREALNNRSGQQVRAGADNSIEAWSSIRGWMKLMLPGGGTTFATEADRDAVLGAIMGLNVLP